MPQYRINIDGRVYTGVYSSKANALYGAALKDEIDRYRECGGIDAPLIRSACYKDLRNEAKAPTLVGIEVIVDHKIPKKIRRIE